MNRILLVDDDEDLAEMVRMVLSSAGMEVQCLFDGNGLYQALETFRPSLVLMDIYLGGQDGRALCKSIKADPAFGGLPIILYSAAFIPELSIKESMADYFMPKPFDIKQLLDKIGELTLVNDLK